jgi:hypothetical protein
VDWQGPSLRAVRENRTRMSNHDRIDKLLMGQAFRFPFAGPLGETVPAIFQTGS